MSPNFLDDKFFEERNEISPEGATTTITESAPLSGSANTESANIPPEKRSLAKKSVHLIKTRVKNYIHNLDPRDKDKFWWTGSVLSAGVSAGLSIASLGKLALLKSISTATTSIGVYTAEKWSEKKKFNGERGMITQEVLPEKIAKAQETYPKATSRIRRFLLGVSAGSIYGGAFGLGVEAIQKTQVIPKVKNIVRRDIDVLRRDLKK
jgi:hypothetical protein